MGDDATRYDITVFQNYLTLKRFIKLKRCINTRNGKASVDK
jgi:hypothetical protein